MAGYLRRQRVVSPPRSVKRFDWESGREVPVISDVAVKVKVADVGIETSREEKGVVIPTYVPTIEETVTASGAHCQGGCASASLVPEIR